MTPKTDTPPVSQPVAHQFFERGRVSRSRSPVAVEAALELTVNGRPYTLLMQTPGREEELVVGFLYTEGLINAPAEIAGLKIGPGQGFLGEEGLRAEASLPGLSPETALPERLALSLASCGLCGKESLEQLGRGISRVRSRQRFPWAVVFDLLADLPRHQPLYAQTRGVHAAALYKADGSFLCCFEDVGRHNALDKVIGHGLLSGWAFEDKAVVLSGRASLEMILKAARAGLPLFLCFSSPTLLAVNAAKALNMTLVGRQDDWSLAAYTHTRRLSD